MRHYEQLRNTARRDLMLARETKTTTYSVFRMRDNFQAASGLALEAAVDRLLTIGGGIYEIRESGDTYNLYHAADEESPLRIVAENSRYKDRGELLLAIMRNTFNGYAAMPDSAWARLQEISMKRRTRK